MKLVIIWVPNMMKKQNIAIPPLITLCLKGCIIFQPWIFHPQTIHPKIFSTLNISIPDFHPIYCWSQRFSLRLLNHLLFNLEPWTFEPRCFLSWTFRPWTFQPWTFQSSFFTSRLFYPRLFTLDFSIMNCSWTLNREILTN